MTAPASILIVDDEPADCRLLQALLEPKGYVTRTAASGEEALALIADDPPDLILLDVLLAEMDGRQVASAVKADPATSNIPIVILTSQTDHKARLAALDAGAEEFLTKPVDRTELWLRVRNLLRLRSEFDGLVQAVPDALVGVDSSGLIRFVNRQAETMFGFGRGELVGVPVEMLVPDSSQQAHSGLREGYGAATGTIRHMGTDLRPSGRRADGSEFPVDIALSPMDTADGPVVVAAVRDMTRYRDAEAERHRLDLLAAVVESSHEAIIASTLDGTITSWNPAAEMLFGYSAAEMVGQSGGRLSPGDRNQEIIDTLARIGAGESGERRESRRVRRDGTVFPVSLTISPIRDAAGLVIGASTITVDLTDVQALKSARHIASIVEHSAEAIISATLDGVVTSWNPAAERLFGYTREDIIGRSVKVLIPNSRTGEAATVLAQVRASQQATTVESMRVRKDGTKFPVSLTVSPVCDAQGVVIGVSTIARDLTSQKEAVELSRSMIEASLDCMVSISVEGTLTGVNEATVALTGVPRARLIGTPFSDYFTDPGEVDRIYRQVLAEGTARDHPLTIRHRDGSLTEVLYNASVYHDIAGKVLGVFAAARDVTEQVRAERDRARLREDLRLQLANTDPLTGLPNRQALYSLGPARLLKRRGRGRALLLLDLNKFKEVNDSLGHDAGDHLLIELAARLRDQVRDEDLLVRLGGDEFAALLQDAGHEEAMAVATKLQAALAERIVLNGVALHSSASIGIALFPAAGPGLSALLRKADIAMYKAKTSGDGIHVYGSSDDNDGAARLRTEDELRTAMACDQLMLHYQPKIDLDTGDVHSVEALVRWDHPTRGLLYPESFLALVEDSGLMRTMTQRVLEMALDQAATWQSQGQHLTIAVNLSASSLVDADLPDQIIAMLEARGVPPEALQLEITEEFLMADRDRARNILTLLRQSGIQLSLDDFGTGYSSLSYLRELPVDELKLDQSFVMPMADDARAAALVASTVALAHSLGLRMVAEGVENPVAYAELKRLGCEQAQGFFISRPVPAAALEHWLSTRVPVDQSTDIPVLNWAAAQAEPHRPR